MWFFDKTLRKWQNHWNDWEWICTSSVHHHQSRRLGHYWRGKGMCKRSLRRTCATLRRSRWTRKMTHLGEFMYYDDWLGAIKKLFKVSSNVIRRAWLFRFWMPFLLRGLYFFWGSGGIEGRGVCGKPVCYREQMSDHGWAEGLWEHRAKMEENKETRNPLGDPNSYTRKPPS